MLSFAAELGYLKKLQTLLVPDFQCNPAAEDNYAIRIAAEKGHSDVVKYLMEEVNERYGADPAAEDNYAIRNAAFKRVFRCREIFLRWKLKWNLQCRLQLLLPL